MGKQTPTLTPAIITIFGITGDLAKRKLLPSLYHLANDGLLPKSTKIVGVNRSGTTVDAILSEIKDSVESNSQVECRTETLEWLRGALSAVTMDVTDQFEYSRLKSELDSIEDMTGTCLTRIFYLAIPSTMFDVVIDRLGKQDLNTGCQHGEAESRLLIEKPFGYDLESAKELIATIQSAFNEEQVYRIDHYLAKETVQNILTFRFQNPLFANIWDSKHVSHILVTAAESIGIEGRVAFYEQTGALRELIQSHLLQLVALVTMEKPETMDAKNIHAQKVRLLKQLLPPRPDKISEETVRGQYDTYEKEVDSDHSDTETFAAIHLSIDSPRWQNVPVLIRTGKAMAEKVTEITLVYADEELEGRNTLTIRIQPNEGIVLDLRIKRPGYDDEIEHVQMDFCYNKELRASHPNAYERVLVDALRGDKTLFTTSEEILAGWKITEPILEAWTAEQYPLDIYKTGSWGPKRADDLAENAGTQWLTDTLNICNVHGDNKG